MNKKSTLLQVISILQIVFSGIAALILLLALVAGTVLASGLVIFASLIGLASAGFNLYAGIVGVKNCAKPENAQKCFTIGVIMVVLAGVNVVLGLVSNGFSISSITNLVLPVLYLIGANQLKAM